MEEAPKYKVTTICEAPDNKEMTLNEYQNAAMATCMDSCCNISYMLTEIVSEAGELAGKYAKMIRKEWLSPDFSGHLTEETEFLIDAEIGDILWGLAGLCAVRGRSLEQVAKQNLAKLISRQERGVIDGSGDTR